MKVVASVGNQSSNGKVHRSFYTLLISDRWCCKSFLWLNDSSNKEPRSYVTCHTGDANIFSIQTRT
ncbi:hypothetical protein T02_4392 [Trichinella nativa]|uniref:Uncharacterized protein n=1 Tax=Trichinella nativa TaxID=6335 RepID=A0A0V1LKW7_9BILA|nr:hypothetical protein T06_4994 [Trichinella sp. T6]KRZ60160.1 hypothetical protein T02_4392 [Trichinella nativa]